MLKITFLLLLTLLCCLFIGCLEPIEHIPTVNLMSDGKGKTTDQQPIVYGFSLEIDKPLDHDLLIAIRTEEYRFVSDQSELGSPSGFNYMFLIRKGSISTGVCQHGYRGEYFADIAKIVLTVLPPEYRLRRNEDGLIVPIQEAAAPCAYDGETLDPEDIIIDIPVGYDFKPYTVGTSSQISFSFP